MIKLYSAPLSLFGKKVEVALHEKGIAFERVLVAFTQSRGYSPKHPDVLASNPKGQVPVLVDDDLTLFDSTVILEYLEDAHPLPPLYPCTPAERARCRLLELFADEIMLVPLRALMHRTGPRPGDTALWDSWEEKAGQAMTTHADQFGDLDERLEGRAHFCGEFSVADIAVFMMVFYAQRLAGPRLAPFPRLATWYRRLKERPAIKQAVAEIAQADEVLSAPVDGAYPD